MLTCYQWYLAFEWFVLAYAYTCLIRVVYFTAFTLLWFYFLSITNLLCDGTVFYMQADVTIDCSVVRSGRNLTVVAMEFKVKKTGQLAYTARAIFYNMPIAKIWSCGSTNLNLGISVWISTFWWVSLKTQ